MASVVADRMFRGRLAAVGRIGPYGMAAATQAGSSFIVLPLLLAALGANAYGRFALLEPIVVLLAQFLVLGAHQGLIHAICKEGIDARGMTLTLLTGIQRYAIPLLLAIFFVISYWTGRRDVGGIFCLGLYLEAMNLIMLTAMRAKGEAWTYCCAVFAKAAGSVTAAIAVRFGFVSAVPDESVGLWIMAVAAGLSVAVLAVRVYLWPRAVTAVLTQVDGVRRSIRYGFPLILAGLCQSVLSIADRYVLAAFVPSSVIASYVVCSKYANALNLVATPVNLWWPTARFRRQQAPGEGRAFFGRATALVALLYAAIGGTLIVLAPYLLPKLGPGVHSPPVVASMLITVAFLMGIQVILNVGLLSEGHTHKMFYIAAGVAALHLLICFAIAPVFGALGVASVGVVSGALFVASVNHASQKIFHVKQPIFLIVALVIALVTMSSANLICEKL